MLKPLARLTRSPIRVCQILRIWFYRFVSLGTKTVGYPKRWQPVHCIGRGTVVFGENVQIGLSSAYGFLSTSCFLNPRAPDSVISFGNDCFVNNGVSVIAEFGKITIGDRVLIGPQVCIFDSDFHGLTIETRQKRTEIKHGNVVIGDDVFIGANSIILKAVKIGNGAVIGAGAVVTKDVPANSIVAGNPARVLQRD